MNRKWRSRSRVRAHRIAYTSWRRLWDIALDHGVKGTRAMQAIFRELCRPSSCFQCSLCDAAVSPSSSCLEHVCTNHPSEMENLSYDNIMSLLIDADSTVSLLSICRRVSCCSSFWSFKHCHKFCHLVFLFSYCHVYVHTVHTPFGSLP